MLSLYRISDGLPPHYSRFFTVTCYHASKLISTSRFQCEIESDIDQLHVQMSAMLREGKKDPHFCRTIGKPEKQQLSVGAGVFSAMPENIPQF